MAHGDAIGNGNVVAHGDAIGNGNVVAHRDVVAHLEMWWSFLHITVKSERVTKEKLHPRDNKIIKIIYIMGRRELNTISGFR